MASFADAGLSDESAGAFGETVFAGFTALAFPSLDSEGVKQIGMIAGGKSWLTSVSGLTLLSSSFLECFVSSVLSDLLLPGVSTAFLEVLAEVSLVSTEAEEECSGLAADFAEASLKSAPPICSMIFEKLL